jgi:hypothetical protein
MMARDGAIKTFPLRGIKDTPSLPARRPATDPGRYGGVLQPGAGHQADGAGEEGPGELSAHSVIRAMQGEL